MHRRSQMIISKTSHWIINYFIRLMLTFKKCQYTVNITTNISKNCPGFRSRLKYYLENNSVSEQIR